MQAKVIHLAALAATFACGTALAQTTPPTTSPGSASTSAGTAGAEYTKMDKDKDGTLSKKEASSNKELTKQWDTLDVNKDGKLDEAEFAQFESSSMGSGAEGPMKKDDKVNY